MPDPVLPVIIQGGMGVGVSGWRLASAVAQAGQLGVVSGVALDAVLARRLQLGDPGGHLRRALSHFPEPGTAARILQRYYVPGGISPGTPFRPVPRLGLRPSHWRDELTAAGNFVTVWLARQGHHGLVGVNYLEKVQLATPAAVYGAMLAGVDYVLMGAGIPSEIPALLDTLAAGSTAELPVTVAGAAAGERYAVTLDPVALADPAGPVRRPQFLAIVSSAVLALYLNRSPVTRPDGFVLETPAAGGHSAPPRGRMQLSATGEPVYGPRDRIDVAKVAGTGLPFWLAGGYATPQALAAARAAGAVGIQAGTAFALCRESGLDPELRRQLLGRAADGSLAVRNDPRASPTRVPVQGRPATRNAVGGGDVPGPVPAVRSGISARPVPAGEWHGGLPLPGRTGRCLRPQRRPGRRHGQPALPVQRAHRRHRPGPAPAGRLCRASHPHPRPGLRLPARPAAG
ncbi:MAG: nitronate monooxygenase [Streptosporangiales bacterium]